MSDKKSSSLSMTGMTADEVCSQVEVNETRKRQQLQSLHAAINEKVMKDTSPAAMLGRRRAAIRAIYGEFMCTLLFLTPIFGAVGNAAYSGYSGETVGLIAALVSGFQAIAVCFAFSSVSGAHFNPNISFALWLTGMLSNRKFVGYVFAQLLASVLAMAIIGSIFTGDTMNIYEACTVTPVDDNRLGKIFATEFFTTFILTYVAFTVAFEDAEHNKKSTFSLKRISDSKGLTVYASTPQSKTGFAPFSIGLTIFSLCLIGGTSGGAFNQARMFGPALFSGKWNSLWMYWLAQLCGAATASLLVTNLHRYGLSHSSKDDSDSSAEEAVSSMGESKAMNPMAGGVRSTSTASSENNV